MLQNANYIVLAVADALTSEGVEITTASAAAIVWPLLIIGAIAVFRKKIIDWWTGIVAEPERQFFETIVKDVAKWLSDNNLSDREQAETELREALRGKTSEYLRQRDFALDCRFVRTAPSTCDRVLVATIKTEDNDYLQAPLKRSIEWCWVPSAIRKEFIRSNQSELVYDMLKKKRK
ncbi:MAG: hypothetical protein IJ991_12760 [Thermoguttaceae bacterium]|nr:hypothetical protein [Thermoguttaceae bacterium]